MSNKLPFEDSKEYFLDLMRSYEEPKTVKIIDHRRKDMSMVMSENITELTKALLKAQTKMSNATKGSSNPFFKSSYADLNAIREVTQPVLNAEGITVLQPIVQKDGKSFVRTLLLHESGQYIGSDVEVVVSKQNDPQATGSAISYARRYGLQSLLSVGAKDDDGEAAMGRDNRNSKQAPASQSPVKSGLNQKPSTPEWSDSTSSVSQATQHASSPAPTDPVSSGNGPVKKSTFRKPSKTAVKEGSSDDGWQ